MRHLRNACLVLLALLLLSAAGGVLADAPTPYRVYLSIILKNRLPTPTPTPTNGPTPTPVPSLSGRVTDVATGQGIAGAAVEASLAGPHDWVYSATTASDGSYAMFGLPTGDYIVRVIAPGYAREYYDNVTPSCDAEIIHVTALCERSGIDFDLTAGGSISGHIYQSDGVTPIAGAKVFVRPTKYRFDDGFWTETDSNGSYTVENLYLGSFRVTAKAEGYVELVQYYDGSYGWSNALDVVVTPPNDIPGIDINLDLAGSISGFVYASDGVTPIPHVSLFADNVAGVFEEGFEGNSNHDGSYIIEGIPPGNYTVRTETAHIPNWYAAEFYDSKYTWGTADQVVVSEGNNSPNINFTLDEGGSITGYVFDEDTGEPLEDIHLFSYLPDGDCTAPVGTTLYDGSYKFVLKPGEYLVGTGTDASSVLGYRYVPEWYDSAYDMSAATPINVTLHNETFGIDLYLAKSGSISGHVYEEDGVTPIAGASVYAFPITGDHPGGGANTGADGSYTIEGLLSGSYKVQAAASDHAAEYYDNAPDEEFATEVRVNAPGDTPGIDFSLSRVSEQTLDGAAPNRGIACCCPNYLLLCWRRGTTSER